MQSFPMFIRTTGRRVVIAGGGEQAAQKARLVTRTDASLVLLAPDLDPELAALVDAGHASWHQGPVTAALFEGAAMGFVATGCPGIDASLHALAVAARCPVNVVDQPALCDLTTPSIVDRDPVVVAIGTEGTAPVLARQIKTEVERLLPPNIGQLAAFAGRMRAAVAARIPREDRRAFWRWVFGGDPAAAWTRGAERAAARQVKDAIARGGAPDAPGAGAIAYVGAGPGARDLMTMRGVARLQEADVIFYDRLVDPDVLELARRDAERVYVGKVVGAHAWPQDRINAAVVGEARKGRRVVRLKSGDPGIFGRLDEELAAARAVGIATEIVPGVTAACAAAATLGRSLTSRGRSDTLMLTTARRQTDGAVADVSRLAKRGTELAIYMGVSAASDLAAQLAENGLPVDARVEIVSEASTRRQTQLRTTLGAMARDIEAAGITGCALILVSNPGAPETLVLEKVS
ncbi:siroheme synthase CysG [Palleronia pelagia]|uniref:Uroporphyrin-III C-methyltransferase / precorrin-2 dehydrogenase / sirohydrochlorin ferrochelatase n=1 Tax=Palleronia pelagia TaxID=387096 RepID=A0A1H8C448_9RHOB|nr:siroheme synthase CysG [Palleronia pelagia]SEM89742.1 uroporphyrin-III C-methyltransferase / precorrin-2 dehydrogenase / sirohydrochlorin ferrochelatase [Palleronia pelagia]